jgi:hypothetical protein
MKHEKAMLKKAIMKMIMRMMSMAFVKWKDEAAAMAREKYMLAGAIKRMLLRHLSMAFEKWQA